jgi:multidrug efflux pump subunit AcrB
MSFSGWVERHGRSVLFVAGALALGGLAAGFALPVGLFPVTSFPRIRAEISAGSMPARQMLLDVTQPLEQVARAVPGAASVESTTSRGAAEMFVDFPWGFDMTQALLSVEAAFAQKLPELAPGTSYDVIQMSPNILMPFVSYALTSDSVPPAELRRLAQYQIAPLLSGIAGVRRIGVLGGQTPEVQVSVRPDALSAYGLTLADLTQAIAASNVVSAVGRLEDNDRLFLAVQNDAFTSADSVRALTLHIGKSGVVRLGDIADVRMGAEPQWLSINNNGRPAVTFDVYQQDSADALTLAREVDRRVADFMARQPHSIGLYKWYDQTELVRSSMSAVAEAIVIGLILAAGVVFGFLRNGRATLIALIVVPLAVMTSVLLLAALGMTFNIMTLGGIAAAIGLLIDDVIVMVEHIARRAGAPQVAHPRATVLEAAAEFLPPLIGSSLASVVIFVPLAFLSGVAGAFFKFLSLTMAAALVISFALTAFAVPLLVRRLIDFELWHDPGQQSVSRLQRAHGRLLQTLFARPMLIGLAVAVLLALGLLAYTRVGTGFLPRVDEGGFVLDYYTAPGTSLTETNRELAQVEAILRADPNVYTYSRRTGAGLGGDLKETYQGDFFVRLVPASRRRSIWSVMDDVTGKITTEVPGIHLEIHQLLGDMIGDMVGRPQPVVVKLHARDPEVLGSVARQVAAAVAQVRGIEPASVNNGVVPAGDALEIAVDAAAAASQGMTAADVQAQATAYLNGAVATRYLGPVQDVGVRVWLRSAAGRIYRDRMYELPIRAPSGRVLTLGTLARVDFVAGQPELTRDNLAQIVAVTAELTGAHDLGSTIAGLRRALDRPGLIPAGVSYSISGAYEQEQIAARGMLRVFVAAVLAEIILLLYLYERFWIPVIIVASSLVSTSAVFLGLWITGTELNITAMMGMVMIVGISTEMAVFLVSEYQTLEGEMPGREALSQAARDRLRPILMSTLAMILALIPLAAAISGSGDQMLQPLAIAIISGALIQLPLVLLAMPVVIGLTLRDAAGAIG